MKTSPITDRQALPGIILVVIGLVLLGAQWFSVTGGAVLGGIAAVFLAAHVGTGIYGLRIPGLILAGLAFGVGLQESGIDPQGGFVVIGLAGGFLAIYLVDAITGHTERWWPLIPGGILAVVGTSELVEGTAAAETVARLWPLAIIVAGITVLLGAIRAAPSRGGPAVTRRSRGPDRA